MSGDFYSAEKAALEKVGSMAFDLDMLVTDIEGAASALAGLNSEEVPHSVGPGRAWLAGEINGLVHKLRVLTDSIFEAAKGPQNAPKAVAESSRPRGPAVT